MKLLSLPLTMVAALALGAMACTKATPPRVDSTTRAQMASDDDFAEPSTDPAASVPTATRADPSVACPETRLIGVQSGAGMCPAAGASPRGQWEATKLFASAGGDLGRFCVYEWVGAGAPDRGPGVLPTDGHAQWSDWLHGDCNVVAPLGSAYTQLAASTFEAAFFAQVERVEPTLTGPVTGTPVYLIDSAVDHPPPMPGDGRLAHGRTLGTLVRRLTCPVGSGNSGCLAAASTRLALALRYDQNGRLVRDVTNGGFFGSLTDLAQTIYEASSASTGPAVLNLSLGWDPEWGGGYVGSAVGTLSPPLQAVHKAISYARCRGAVVVAAAGNDTGGAALSPGPMYPGAWENKPMPTAAECSALGVTGPPAASSAYQPLLYAVSGVDGRDGVLGNARPGSQTRLTAPGSQAVFTHPTTGTGAATEVYTGSSVAAAVASAAVAAAWTFRPQLAGPDVVDLVYDHAIDLGRASDFCLGATCPNQRRLSLCRTIEAACASNVACSVTPACASSSAGRDARPSPPPVPPAMKIQRSGANLTAQMTVTMPCNGTVNAAPGAAITNPCPRRQLFTHEAQPWVDPQPGGSPCPMCKLSEPDVLVMVIDSRFTGALSDPVLSMIDINGHLEYFALGVPEGDLQAGAVIEVHGLPIDIGQVEMAGIEFIVDGAYSTFDPLLVGQ